MASGVAGERTGLRILITEDDAALGEALRHSLTHDGYAVDWVQSGATADKSLMASWWGSCADAARVWLWA